MLGYHLEHIFSISAKLLQPPQVIGPVGEGLRINFYIESSEATGPKVKGKGVGAGADWFTLRPDGVGIVDVRGTLLTDDGATIYVYYKGVMEFGEDGYRKALEGNFGGGVIQIRTNPWFQTAHPKYRWLNRLLCLGIGQSDPATSTVTYDIYAVR